MAGKWAVIKENASDCVENCVAAASLRKITTVFQTYAFVSQRTNTPNAKKELCKIKLLELAHTVDENAKCTITHNECWIEPNEIDLNYLVVYICVHFAMCILSCTILLRCYLVGHCSRCCRRSYVAERSRAHNSMRDFNRALDVNERPSNSKHLIYLIINNEPFSFWSILVCVSLCQFFSSPLPSECDWARALHP